MTDLLLATANPHKVDELRAIIAAALHDPRAAHSSLLTRSRLFTLADPAVPRTVEPAETGTTFADNARIKARSYAAQTRLHCLADDSGLEIDALHGRPGVISSHYSTDGRETGLSRPERDAANNARVLRELVAVAFEQRTARFVCCMCLAAPDGTIIAESRGTFDGRIGVPSQDDPHSPYLVPRGDHGFGYDPLFLVPPDFRLTSAELSPSDKNARSHRAAALLNLARTLALISTVG